MKISGIKERLSGYFSKGTRTVGTVELSPKAVADLRFYQFKASTASFLFERIGRTDVLVRDTPHFALAAALVSGDADEVRKSTAFYRDYLVASWGERPAADYERRLTEFRAHLEAARRGERMPLPILTKLIEGDSLFVVDGNHRAAFAAAMGKPLKAHIWTPRDAYLAFSRLKEFYGTGHRNLPYQSVFLRGKEVVAGRRNDVVERLSMIPSDAIAGRNILDVASNVGMSSLIARSMGANSCIGLEVSPGMIDQSMRFAMFDDAFPAVRFRRFNIDQDALSTDQAFDTAFMFSIHNHLKRPDKLLRIAESNVTKYVVFEGHPGTKRSDYSGFLDGGLFRSVRQIGSLPESIFQTGRNRILWLCEK